MGSYTSSSDEEDKDDEEISDEEDKDDEEISDEEDEDDEESSYEEDEDGSDEEGEKGSKSGSTSSMINRKASSCASNISKTTKSCAIHSAIHSASGMEVPSILQKEKDMSFTWYIDIPFSHRQTKKSNSSCISIRASKQHI